jgi:hypothetical protein
MRELFGRLGRLCCHPACMGPTDTAQEAHDIELEKKAPTDDTNNTPSVHKPQASPNQDTDSDQGFAQKNAQSGVQKMEATTQVWSKNHLVAAYTM